jgi:DNA repair protein RadC
MKIKEIPLENRPRERMMRDGVGVLSDAELIAVVLQKGTRKENVIDVSNRLIAKFGLDKLASLSLVELQTIDGIGPAKAIQIKAMFEINKRVKYVNRFQIKCSEDVFQYCSGKLADKDKEFFMIIMLDSKNKIIKDEIVSIGTLNSSLVHPREIFKSAIKESANSVILVHNHPSGDPTPSTEDEEITQRLIEAGELLNIKVLDHIIIGKGKCHSFMRDND